MNRTEWLAERKKGIGGSDSAVVLGLSKWKNPYQLWLEKTGMVEGDEDSAAMKWGRLLEPIIRNEYKEITGREVKQPDMIKMKDKPFIFANVDGLCDDRVLEIKTARTSADWGEEGTDEIPVQYYLQVQHYMWVTGKQLADVAVLIGSADFRIYTVPAEPKLWKKMLPHYERFWHFVTAKTAPTPLTGKDALQQFAISRDRMIYATPAIEDMVKRMKDLSATVKQLEDEKEELKGNVALYMGEDDTLADNYGNIIVTWKTAKATERFDSKAFKADYPGLYEKYLKQGEPTRRFLVK